MIYIFPYKNGSRSVNGLAMRIPARKIKIENSKFVGNKKHIVVNWGATDIDNREVMKCRVLNHPDAVTVTSNKLFFFNFLGQREWLPDWTGDREEATDWLGKCKVVCRTVLSGHSGNGIVIAREPGEMVAAQLYVKYIPKVDEYRVHIFNGEVIDIQRKAKRHDAQFVDWKVRSHDNGFIYMREGVEDIPYMHWIRMRALEVVKRTELDFGAVDLIYNKNRNKCYVIEVNTAPGLEGTTLERYAEAIRNESKE